MHIDELCYFNTLFFLLKHPDSCCWTEGGCRKIKFQEIGIRIKNNNCLINISENYVHIEFF